MPEPLSFTCPTCGMTSHNPNDVKFGYCGNCHAYTGPDHTQEQAALGLVCPECSLTQPFHEKGCPTLLRHREEMGEEFGVRHPSLRPVQGEVEVDQLLVRPREVRTEDFPHPGDPDWNDWARLFQDLSSAPGIHGLLFSKRHGIVQHLWSLGYRPPAL